MPLRKLRNYFKNKHVSLTGLTVIGLREKLRFSRDCHPSVVGLGLVGRERDIVWLALNETGQKWRKLKAPIVRVGSLVILFLSQAQIEETEVYGKDWAQMRFSGAL